jgi:hypothetical protein
MADLIVIEGVDVAEPHSEVPVAVDSEGCVLVTPCPGSPPFPVTGTIGVTGPVTVVQPIGTNLHVVVDSGSITVNEFANGINIYGEVVAPFNTETTIISYTVPAGPSFKITAVEVWGDYFAEYFVRINGTQKSGTNVSAAERSKSLEFETGPVVALAGQVITISVQHQAMGNVKFHANLMGSTS